MTVTPRVRPLPLERLDELWDPCRGCAFWQTSDASGRHGAVDVAAQDAWWQAVRLDWGVPAFGAWIDQDLVGYALFAPAVHLPRTRVIGPPVSDDALVLATLAVDLAHRGHGIARQLFQAVMREAVTRDLEAVEAYGRHRLTRGHDAGRPFGDCVVAGATLEALGLRLHQVDAEVGLYRAETARTVRWADSVARAIGGVAASLTPSERVRNRPVLESSDQRRQ